VRIGLSGQLPQDPGSDGPPAWSLIRGRSRPLDARSRRRREHRYPDLLVGADADSGKGSGVALTGSADEIAVGLSAYADLGIAEVIASLEPFTAESVGRFLVVIRGTEPP